MNNIIPESLEYYYTNYISIKKIADLLYNKDNELEYFKNNTKYSLPLEITINDNPNIYKIPYQIIGYYNENSNIWQWGWAYDYSRDIDIKICLKLLNYGLSLNIRRDDMELKTKIITSQFKILNDIELKILVSTICYLTHNVYIYNIRLNENEKIFIQLNLNELKKYNLI